MTAAQTLVDLDSAYALSPEQVRFFRQNGYIKLKQVFSSEALARYGERIRWTVAEHNTQAKPLEQRSVYDQAFLQIHNLWTKNATVKEFVFGRRLARLAAELMGCQGVRLYHDQALFKEPGGGITPWHADQYYWPLSSDRSITAWVPLQPTPLEMGPLSFAPGSFRIESGRDLEIGTESEEKLQRSLKAYPVDETPFELGEVSFHSGWTFHRAGANRTDRMRAAMTVIYIDSRMRLARPKNKNQENDRAWWCPGVEVGQSFASPLNPVLYQTRA